jgi:RNA-binding protein 5/10
MPGYSSHGYGHGHGHGPILTGETDEDPKQMPSQFIVIRELEASVTEEVLAKGVMKLFREDIPPPAKDTTKPGNKLKSTAPTASNLSLGAAPGSLRRVFLIRDRRTNESWRYGFAEFATIEDAKGAVAKYHALPKFTISSKLVIVAFIHTGVFVPTTDPATDELARFSFAPIYNPSVRVKYWDDRAYPNVLVINAPEPVQTDEAAEKTTGSAVQDASTKKSRKDREALAQKIASKMAGVAMAPQMQMWAKKSAEIHGASKKSTGDVPDSSASQGSKLGRRTTDAGTSASHIEESTDPVAQSWRDQYVSYADWDTIECLLCGKFSQEEWLIYHETHVHDHFKDEELKAKAATLLTARGKQPRTIIRRTPRRKCDAPQPYTSYADQDSLTCYLCMRKLPDIKTLRRHEQESELHKKNLSNPSKVESATAKLAEVGWKPTRMLPLGYDGPLRLADKTRGYRDRAKERRHVYNQPHKPKVAPAETSSNTNKRKPVAEEEAEPPAKKSKGAGLLAKMGWSAGEGLGASGDGRKEAVGADVYVPGVGLGAEGGKLGDAAEEAARKTRGDQGGFVEKTREKARERFERLG